MNTFDQALKKPSLFAMLFYKQYRTFLFITLLLSSLVIVNFLTYMGDSLKQIELQHFEELRLVAKLKETQLNHWLDEHEKRLSILKSSHSMVRLLKSNTKESQLIINDELDHYQKNLGLTAVIIQDRQGHIVSSTGDFEANNKTFNKLVGQALSTNTIQNTGLYHTKINNMEQITFSLATTFDDSNDFVIIISVDKSEFLFPFLQKWSSQKQSAEILLFKKEPYGVRFLNELRHEENTAMIKTVQKDRSTVLAIQIINKLAYTDTYISGTDYRNEPVIGVSLYLPKFDWYLIAKVDKADVYQNFYQTILIHAITSLLTLISIFTIALMFIQRKFLYQITSQARDVAESSLDVMFEVVPDIYYKLSSDSVITDYRAQKKGDSSVGSDCFLGKKITDVLPEPAGEVFDQNLDKLFNVKSMVTFEYPLNADEDTQWFEARMSLLPEHSIIVLIRNITEQKKSQQALIRAKLIIEKSRVVLFRWHANGWLVEFVSANIKQFGYTPEQFLSGNLPYPSIIHPEDIDSVIDSFSYYAAEKLDDFAQEYRIISPSGDVFWIQIGIQVIRDENGETLYYQGTVFNRTEQRMLEKQVSYYNRLFESSLNEIYIFNGDSFRLIDVNQGTLENTGYTLTEIKNLTILALTPVETQKSIFAKFQLLRNKTQQKLMITTTHQRKDGSTYPVEAYIELIDDESHLYIAVVHDITERERQRVELDKYRDNLENLVESRTQELNHTKKIADNANKAKSNFLANMSHEIRTPMNAIMGFTHILSRTEINSTQRSQLKKIDSSAGHLLTIINDILDLSKIESGKLVLENTNFSLDEIFKSLTNMLSEQAKIKGLHLALSLTDVPVWLKGDSTRIQHALMNYLTNAIKFSADGNIDVITKVLETNAETLLVKFSVTDQGCGVNPEYLDGIFKVFQQADTSTTRKFGGTGLGLTITKELAKLMNGQVGVESKLGEGSTFWFTAWLSLGEEVLGFDHSISELDNEKILKTSYLGANILVVEDNEINAEVAQLLLTSAGLTVDIAENGLQAIEKVNDKTYDLVLMDVQMPVMDGLKATHQIRLTHNKESLPILAMSASAFNNDRQACIDVGMNDFVAKPVSPDNLFSTLLKWLPIKKYSHNTVLESNEKNNNTDISVLKQLQNITFLQADKGIKNCAGSIKNYLSLLSTFDEMQIKITAELKEQLTRDSFEDAKQSLHALKGTSGNLGLENIYQDIQRLEDKLESNTLNEEDELIIILDADLQCFSQAINALYLPDLTKVKTDENPINITKALANLYSLLSADNPDANTYFDTIAAELFNTYGTPAEVIKHHIHNFDYLLALDVIGSLPVRPIENKAESAINMAVLNEIFGENSCKPYMFLKKFVPQAELLIKEITYALTQQDTKTITFNAHKLTSSARAIGAEQLADIFEQLEQVSKDKNITLIEQNCKQISEEMKKVSDYIKAL
jgi:two-component system sensor histidine kinase/response regulator